MCVGTHTLKALYASTFIAHFRDGGRGPLEKRASPFLGKGRHLRTVPKLNVIIYASVHLSNIDCHPTELFFVVCYLFTG